MFDILHQNEINGFCILTDVAAVVKIRKYFDFQRTFAKEHLQFWAIDTRPSIKTWGRKTRKKPGKILKANIISISL